MKNHIIMAWMIFVLGCGNSVNDDSLQEIRNQVLKHISYSPHLATLQVIYGIDFLAYHPHWVFADDFYLRKDIATIFYGVNLSETKIEIIPNDKKGILKVRIPQPRQVSIDRRIAAIYFNNKLYHPKDNPDESINRELSSVITKNEKKIIEQTKNMTRLFFDTLAYRFDLDLDFESVPEIKDSKK